MVIPTEMKKSPSSKPLNGSMSVSRACRYSELASRTPARNAPRPIDKPTSDMICAMPITSNKVNDVNTSRRCVLATSRNKGLVR